MLAFFKFSQFFHVSLFLQLCVSDGQAQLDRFSSVNDTSSQLIIDNLTMDRRRKKPLGDQGDFAGDADPVVLLKKRADSAERSRRYRARQKDGRSNSPLSTLNACSTDENQHPNKRISVLQRSTTAARKRCSPLTIESGCIIRPRKEGAALQQELFLLRELKKSSRAVKSLRVYLKHENS
ncbi:hypothetical protein EJB05_20178, partial [Eragrostis curvula]